MSQGENYSSDSHAENQIVFMVLDLRITKSTNFHLESSSAYVK